MAILGRISHECFIGLWLNAGRVEHRRALPILAALQTATTGLLSREMLESLADSPEEAKGLEERQRAAAEAAAMETGET